MSDFSIVCGVMVSRPFHPSPCALEPGHDGDHDTGSFPCTFKREGDEVLMRVDSKGDQN